jgi:hypothetical protein
MSSTKERRERRKAKKEAQKKAAEDKKKAEEAERLRRETPKYQRDEKRQRLLGQLEEVKDLVTDNIEKGLANYGATNNLDRKAADLVQQASEFERTSGRVESRAFWDKMAKKIYAGLVVLGILFFGLGLTFHVLDICEREVVPPLQQHSDQNASATSLQQPSIGDEPAPLPDEAWIECPTYWMAMFFTADILCIIFFWFRKKVCCFWCDCCRLGRCECCLRCPMQCCKNCGK